MFLFSLIQIKVNSTGDPLYWPAKISVLSNYAYPPKTCWMVSAVGSQWNIHSLQRDQMPMPGTPYLCVISFKYLEKHPPPCDVPYSNGAFILNVFYMGLSASTLYWPPCLLAANPISKYHYIFQLQTNKRTRGDSLTFLGSHGCGSMVTCQLPPMSSSTAPRSSAQSISSGKLAVSSLTLPGSPWAIH